MEQKHGTRVSGGIFGARRDNDNPNPHILRKTHSSTNSISIHNGRLIITRVYALTAALYGYCDRQSELSTCCAADQQLPKTPLE